MSTEVYSTKTAELPLQEDDVSFTVREPEEREGIGGEKADITHIDMENPHEGMQPVAAPGPGGTYAGYEPVEGKLLLMRREVQHPVIIFSTNADDKDMQSQKWYKINQVDAIVEVTRTPTRQEAVVEHLPFWDRQNYETMTLEAGKPFSLRYQFSRNDGTTQDVSFSTPPVQKILIVDESIVDPPDVLDRLKRQDIATSSLLQDYYAA